MVKINFTFRSALFFLLMAYLISIQNLQVIQCSKGSQDEKFTLFDMKLMPSDYECLLLANHVYNSDIKEGDIVQYTKEDLMLLKNYAVKNKTISYLFLALQTLSILGFVLFTLYDFIFYLEKSNTWHQTLANNYYLLAIGLLKLIGVIMLVIESPLVFSGSEVKTKIDWKNKDFTKFNKQGWQVLRTFKDEKFIEHTSVLYLNKEKTKIVFAIQGSNSWRDWIYTNWPTVVGQQPKGQIKLMLEFLEKSLREAKKYNINIITITGHSLGGFLAQVCKLLADIHFDQSNIHIRGVAYDSPGVHEMLNLLNCNTENNRVDLHTLDITNYVSTPNLINATNSHTGSIYMIKENFSIEPNQVSSFFVLLAKLFFYGSTSFLTQLFLTSFKNSLDGGRFGLLSDLTRGILYWTVPIVFFMLIGWLFLYKFHFKWLPAIRKIVYSYYHHSLGNFINAGNEKTGTINALEVGYFPERNQLYQGPIEFFPESPEDQVRYSENMKLSPMGIYCYVKNNNNSNSRFLYIRNMPTRVRMFLQQMGKKYPDVAKRNTVFQLLGLSINYVYNKQGILQGIQSTKDDLDIHIIIDYLATLLHKKIVVKN